MLAGIEGGASKNEVRNPIQGSRQEVKGVVGESDQMPSLENQNGRCGEDIGAKGRQGR